MSPRRLARHLLLPGAVLVVAFGGGMAWSLATTHLDAAFSQAIDKTARDVSPSFARLWTAAGPDRPRIEAAFADIATQLENARLVIVPSYLSDGLQVTNRIGLTDYFASQIDALRDAGLTVELAPVDTEARVAANAGVLADRVAASDRPVCFVSHSKGGLDVLEFLRTADTATRAKISCWLALQAPFHGSPIADLAAGTKPLRVVADPLAHLLGGDGESLDDLTVARRLPYMTEYDADVRAIVAEIPTLAVATRIDTPSFSLPTIYMRPAYDWMIDHDLPNDGLVAVPSAVLPGARYIVISDVDHTDTVADNPIVDTPEKRLLLLKALLALTLDGT